MDRVTPLVVTVPARNRFYTLFADGPHYWKTWSDAEKANLFSYPPDAVVFLYYTYPTHREACAVRNAGSGEQALLPGLSKKVNVLFRVRASKTGKLKRAVAFLNKNTAPGAYSREDGFYIRLRFMLEQRGQFGKLAAVRR